MRALLRRAARAKVIPEPLNRSRPNLTQIWARSLTEEGLEGSAGLGGIPPPTRQRESWTSKGIAETLSTEDFSDFLLFAQDNNLRAGTETYIQCLRFLKEYLGREARNAMSRTSTIVGIVAALTNWVAAIADDRLRVELSQLRVGKYEKVELAVSMESQSLSPGRLGEVEAVIDTPGGARFVLPFFSYQHYDRRRAGRSGRERDWIYPIGEPTWKGRFAPSEVGVHSAVVRVKDRRGIQSSERVQFECVPSARKGFLRVSRKDPRFFELSDGEPFFAIGQNLAFIGEGQYVTLSKAEEIFEKLQQNGANYLRIWTCCKDWALAVEARKSAWGRSWNWRPPIVPMPQSGSREPSRRCVTLSGEKGAVLRMSPSHPVALRPATRYRLSGKVLGDGRAVVHLEIGSEVDQELATLDAGKRWTAFEVIFETRPDQRWLGDSRFRLARGGAFWLDELSLREVAGGPELLWEADVNRPRRGSYNPVDSFFLDEIVRAAEKHDLKLQLCLLTRDLYMDSLKDDRSPEYETAIHDARNLLRYAVARWGYSTSVASWEYFNEMDPGRPTDRFYRELGEHLEAVDIYHHLRATSTWHPSARDCRHPELDVAGVHFYLRPDRPRGVRNEVEAVIDRSRFLREHAPAKPALIDEFGLATNDWRASADMRRDSELFHVHNALWASALSGVSGTALFWWWEDLDRMKVYPLYRPLSRFLRGVPFGSEKLRSVDARVVGADLRLVGLQGARSVHVWLVDPRAAWADSGVRGVLPGDVNGAKLELRGLLPGTYRIAWWDTRKGVAAEKSERHLSDGDLVLTVPIFTRDIACSVEGLPR